MPEARRTLTQADKAVAAARAAQGSAGGQFIVGYTTVFDRSVIPDVVERLRHRFPDWRLVSRGKHSISLVRDIKNGLIDAAFIGLHTEAPGLMVETIHHQPLVVALPTRHRLAQKRRLGFDDLRGGPMFWFERRLNPGFHDYCQAFFAQIDFQPEVIPEPPDHHIMLGMIAEGTGLALIPASLRHVRRQGVAFRPLKEASGKLSMGIAIAYSAGNQSPVLPAFLKLVRTSRPASITR